MFFDWTARHRLGRKRILDTLLAVTSVAAAVNRLTTSDWRDRGAMSAGSVPTATRTLLELNLNAIRRYRRKSR